MAQKRGSKENIFPEQYAFVEGSILKKGQAQNNVKSLKPGPFGVDRKDLVTWENRAPKD